MSQQMFKKSAAAHRLHSSHHLKLVQFLPPSGKPKVCAAVWRDGDYVRLASPLMRARGGVRDPTPYARQFPDALESIDTFEETMTWLDAVCYAASDPREVDTACQQHPEWRLHCLRYEGSDANLLEVAGLLRASKTVGAFPEAIMRDCLHEIIRQILKGDPEMATSQIASTSAQGDDVATLDIGPNRVVIITLLRSVVSTDIVRQGILAHHRMTALNDARSQCLLVAPDLELNAPMFLTPRVVITNMDVDHLRASLARMAQR